MNTGDVAALDRYLDEFRDAPVILDHCGLAYTAEKFEHTLALSRYPNLFYKWAHAPSMFGSAAYLFADLNPKLRRLVESFGADRIMWASDATEIQTGYSWADSLFFIKDNPVLSPQEKASIVGRTARKVLNWPLAAKVD